MNEIAVINGVYDNGFLLFFRIYLRKIVRPQDWPEKIRQFCIVHKIKCTTNWHNAPGTLRYRVRAK